MDGSMMRTELTLTHILDRMGTLWAGREVISRVADGSVVSTTYGEVARRSRILSSALTTLGIGPGDRVATLAWNHARHLEAYFGVPTSGAVLHTINPRLHPDHLAAIVRMAGDRALLIDEELLPVLASFRDRVDLPHVIVWSSKGELPEGALDYEALLADGDADAPLPHLTEDTAASMCFTSATTGAPKGVVYSHRALVLHSIVEAMPDMFGLSMHDVVMPVVPMFHVNAWGLPYTSALVGAKLVLPGPLLDPESLLGLVESQRVSFAAGVPTIWHRLLDAIVADPDAHDLSSLGTLLVGGSAAPPAMIAAFDRLGIVMLHAWGMTETTPLGSVARLKPGLSDAAPADQLQIRASQGLPSPLVELRAEGADGHVAHDGAAMGELEARGPWVASGYFGAEHPDRFTDDGWFRTGDIATIDPDGYVRIVDRVADLIKSGGEWISSVDLENALMEHEAVAEAAVIAVPDETWGERPLAAVVLREGMSVDEDALRDQLAARFAKWQIPDRFAFVSEIPKTATGKFSKKDLRERLLGEGS